MATIFGINIKMATICNWGCKFLMKTVACEYESVFNIETFVQIT